MDERDTSSTGEKRVLVFDRKHEIQERLNMIMVCKKLIKSTNAAAQRFPELSEISAENNVANRQFIEIYSDEIRRIRRGETKLY